MSIEDIPSVESVGPRIIVHFGKASAMYYMQSRRIMLVGENFKDAAWALDELRLKVRSGETGT